MPVEEVLVEHRVVVGQRLCQPGEAGGRDLPQGGLVRLEADAAHVQGDAVLAVHLAEAAAAAAAAVDAAAVLKSFLLLLLLLLLLRLRRRR